MLSSSPFHDIHRAHWQLFWDHAMWRYRWFCFFFLPKGGKRKTKERSRAKLTLFLYRCNASEVLHRPGYSYHQSLWEEKWSTVHMWRLHCREICSPNADSDKTMFEDIHMYATLFLIGFYHSNYSHQLFLHYYKSSLSANRKVIVWCINTSTNIFSDYTCYKDDIIVYRHFRA